MNIVNRFFFNLKERERLKNENEQLKQKLSKCQDNINKTNAYYKRLLGRHGLTV